MRYKLIIEYDGTNYAGWNMGKGSVMSHCNHVLDRLVGYGKYAMKAACELGKGVHSYGLAIQLDTKSNDTPEHIGMNMNHELPEDINLTYIAQIEEDFDLAATIGFHFSYAIMARENAEDKRYAFFPKENIDFKKLGNHCHLLEDLTFKAIYFQHIELKKEGQLIELNFVCSEFKQPEVLELLSAFLEFGKGKINESQFKHFTSQKGGNDFAPLPASALFLNECLY